MLVWCQAESGGEYLIASVPAVSPSRVRAQAARECVRPGCSAAWLRVVGWWWWAAGGAGGWAGLAGWADDDVFGGMRGVGAEAGEAGTRMHPPGFLYACKYYSLPNETIF